MNNNTGPLPLLPYLCQPAAILGLILVGELLALVLVLAGSNGFSWSQMGSISLITQWIVLSCTLILCQLRPWLNTLSPIVSGLLAYALCLLLSATVLWVAQLVSIDPFNWQVWLKYFLIAAIFSGILLRYLYLQQQLSNKRQTELQARLQALQSRIRPHFLFNSMNTIASLISIDPNRAERVVEDLSSLFRASLQTPGLVYLEDEIALCHRYIAIEQQRLGERLQMVWDKPEPLPNIQVPSLFLQPLLENAIVHGIQQLPEGGEIHLCLSITNKDLHFTIQNPVPASTSQQMDEGNQVALDNIQNRLQLHYDNQASIKTMKDKHTYTVEIHIPVNQ